MYALHDIELIGIIRTFLTRSWLEFEAIWFSFDIWVCEATPSQGFQMDRLICKRDVSVRGPVFQCFNRFRACRADHLHILKVLIQIPKEW